MRCEWKTIKAEDFCYSVTDGTHDSPKGKENGHYLITSKHLAPYAIDFSSAKRISEEDYKKVIKRSPVEQWDILFSMIGTIGITYLEKNSDIDYACKNMGIFKFNGDKEKAYWLYYFLQTPQAKEYILGHLRGTTQQYLPLGSLRDFPIQVAPTETRERITAILRDIDDQIAVNTAINENLEQQAQAIYTKMFIDNADESWKTGILSDIAVITMGQSPKGDTFNETGEGAVFYQGRTDFGFRFPTRRLYTTEPKRIALCGDVLMSVRAPVGDLNVAYEECCIGRGLAAIRSKDKHQSYVLYTLFTLKNQLDIYNGEGTVFGSINKDTLNSMGITIPPIELMDRFESIANSIDKSICNNYEEICRLQAIRDSLLPKLMNGEIDVSQVKI